MIFIQYVHRYCSSIELGPIFPWEVTKKYGFYTKQIVERYLQTPLPLPEFFPIGQWNRFKKTEVRHLTDPLALKLVLNGT